MLANALMAQREMEIQNMEMSQMQFGGGNRMMGGNGMIYDNDFIPSNEARRMNDNSRYENRAMPNSGKDKGVAHDRAGFIDS